MRGTKGEEKIEERDSKSELDGLKEKIENKIILFKFHT